MTSIHKRTDGRYSQSVLHPSKTVSACRRKTARGILQIGRRLLVHFHVSRSDLRVVATQESPHEPLWLWESIGRIVEQRADPNNWNDAASGGARGSRNRRGAAKPSGPFASRIKRDFAYRLSFVIVEYRWHPLYGKRAPLHRRTTDGGVEVVHVGAERPISRELPAWMVDRARRQAMELGAPQACLDALMRLRTVDPHGHPSQAVGVYWPGLGG